MYFKREAITSTCRPTLSNGFHAQPSQLLSLKKKKISFKFDPLHILHGTVVFRKKYTMYNGQLLFYYAKQNIRDQGGVL